MGYYTISDLNIKTHSYMGHERSQYLSERSYEDDSVFRAVSKPRQEQSHPIKRDDVVSPACKYACKTPGSGGFCLLGGFKKMFNFIFDLEPYFSPEMHSRNQRRSDLHHSAPSVWGVRDDYMGSTSFEQFMVGTNHGRYYDESSCVEESFRADKDEVAARKQPNNNIVSGPTLLTVECSVIPTIDSGYNTASTDPRTSPHSVTSSMSRQAIPSFTAVSRLMT